MEHFSSLLMERNQSLLLFLSKLPSRFEDPIAGIVGRRMEFFYSSSLELCGFFFQGDLKVMEKTERKIS